MTEKPVFHLIDSGSWERGRHFEYYQKQLPCGYSLTARLDATHVWKQAKERNLKFYPVMVWLSSCVINRHKEYRMGLDAEKRPGYWSVTHPVYTVFHKDDETFSDLWTEFSEDFETFYSAMTADQKKFGDMKGPKGKPGQPANFFCISCVPWLDYSGYNTYLGRGYEPALFPILCFGKCVPEGNGYFLSFTFTIHHAAADGYHAARFFNELQERMNAF